MLVQFYLGYRLGLIPIAGTTSLLTGEYPLHIYIFDYLRHATGPLITLTLFVTPLYYLYVRNVVGSLRSEDFVHTMRALGYDDLQIILKLGKFALTATVTMIANQSALLVVGAVFTETVFGWNGIGRLLYDSILKAYYPVLQGVFLLTIFVVAIANFVADITYHFLDPRIKVKSKR